MGNPNDSSVELNLDDAAPDDDVLDEDKSASAAGEDKSGDPPDDKPQNKGDEEGTDETKRKSGFDRKVEKMLRRETELRIENEWLKKQMENGGQSARPATPTQTDKPKFSDYNDLEAYADALTDWKLDHRLKNFSNEQDGRRAAETTQQTYEDRRLAFVKDNPDFQAVLAEVEDITLHPTVIQAMAESEIGPKLVYELAKNVDAVERMSRMTPAQQLKELGKWEERLSQPKPQAKVDKKISDAPPPITATKGGKSSKAPDLSDPNISFEDFNRIRKEQLKQRHR